jgi:hypothetical protein
MHMDFGGLAQTFEIALGVWFAALAGAVIYRCLNGQIPLRGILAHDAAALAAGQPAGERVQLLLAFIFSVGAYAQMALAQQGATALPDPPQQLVAIFAASHGIYLTGKLGRTARLGRFLFNKGE